MESIDIKDILDALTFNIKELCCLTKLYHLVDIAGLRNIGQEEMCLINSNYDTDMLHKDQLSPYMRAVLELLGQDKFKEFYVFVQCAKLCVTSDEKKRLLLETLGLFRKQLRSPVNWKLIRPKIHLQKYKEWSRKMSSQQSVISAIQKEWTGTEKCDELCRTFDIPHYAKNTCTLNDHGITGLVYDCLWSNRCMPFVKVSSCQLHNLRTLRPTAWLSDEVISLYLQVLQKESTDCYLAASSSLVRTSSGFNMVKLGREVRKIGPVSNERNVAKILMPFHDSGHWYLIALLRKDMGTSEVILHCYDSLMGTDTTSWRRVLHNSQDRTRCLFYAKTLLFSNECDIKDISIREEAPLSMHKQENGYDCGVFVCMIAAVLSGSLKVDIDAISQQYINDSNCRASICASIITETFIAPYNPTVLQSNKY
jgi:Protease, Ulp1 family